MSADNENGKIRHSLWFHSGNPDEEQVFAYMRKARKKGMSYTEYIVECVLQYEEGPDLRLRQMDIDTLAGKIADEIVKRQNMYD